MGGFLSFSVFLGFKYFHDKLWGENNQVLILVVQSSIKQTVGKT